MKILRNISYNFDLDEIIRLLSFRQGNNKKKKREPTLQLVNDIEEMENIAQKLIQPQGIYDFLDSSYLVGVYPNLFTCAEQTAIGICTCGQSIVNEISRLSDNGHLVKGVILDAIGSQATEAVAEEMNKIILAEAQNLLSGYDYTQRFSPGYCDWDIEGQKVLFELVPGKKIGVSLTDAFMMNPRKSISFAINFGRKHIKLDKELGTRECASCNRLTCKNRKKI